MFLKPFETGNLDEFGQRRLTLFGQALERFADAFGDANHAARLVTV